MLKSARTDAILPLLVLLNLLECQAECVSKIGLAQAYRVFLVRGVE